MTMDATYFAQIILSLGSIAVLAWKIAAITESEPVVDEAPEVEAAPSPTQVHPALETLAADLTRLRWALTEPQVPVRLSAVTELSLMPGREPLAMLLNMVRDGNFEIRRVAVQRIGAEKDPIHLDVLLQAAKDVRIEVQNVACEGLIGQKDPRVLELFRRLALQGLQYARILGIRGLGAAEDQQELLLEIYRNSTGKVREEAMVALSASSHPDAVSVVREHLKKSMDRNVAGTPSEPIDPAQFKKLLDQEPSLPLLEKLELEVAQYSPKRRKAEVLSRLELIARDSSQDERTRYIAVRGIGFLGGLPARERLEGFSHDYLTAVRFAATITLGKLHNPLVIPVLTKGLRDSSFLVRAAATHYLSDFTQEVSSETFDALLSDPTPLVKYQARKALEARNVSSGEETPAPAVENAPQGVKTKVADPRDIRITAPAATATVQQSLQNLLRSSGSVAPRKFGTFNGFSVDRKKPTLSEILRTGSKHSLAPQY